MSDLEQLLEVAKLYRTLTRWQAMVMVGYSVESPYTGAKYRVELSGKVGTLRAEISSKNMVLHREKAGTSGSPHTLLVATAEWIANDVMREFDATPVHVAEAQAFAELWGAVYGTDLEKYEREADPSWALPEVPAMDFAEWLAAYPKIAGALAHQAALLSTDATPAERQPAPPMTAAAVPPLRRAAANSVMPPDKFRQLWSFGAEPRDHGAGAATVRGDHLAAAIKAVNHALFQGEDHPRLKGTQLEFTHWHDPSLGQGGPNLPPNGMAAIATDGSRASIAIIPATAGEGTAWSALLATPRQLLGALKDAKAGSSSAPKPVKLLGGASSALDVEIGGSSPATVNLLSFGYPSWRDPIPETGAKGNNHPPKQIILGLRGSTVLSALNEILGAMSDEVDKVTEGKYHLASVYKEKGKKETHAIFLPIVTIHFSADAAGEEKPVLVGHIVPTGHGEITDAQYQHFMSLWPYAINWKVARVLGEATLGKPRHLVPLVVEMELRFLLEAAEAIGDAPLEMRLYGNIDPVRIDATEQWPIIHEVIMPRKGEASSTKKPAKRGRK